MATDVKDWQAASTNCDALIEQLNQELEALPRETLLALRQQGQLAVPALVQAMKDATEKGRAGEKVEGHAHFFALFLLMELEAKELLPAIMEALTLPGDACLQLYGWETLSFILPMALAKFAAQTPELIDGLIRDRSLDQSARWDAARSYLYLMRDGVFDRVDVIERLARLLREAIANKDYSVVTVLVEVLSALSPTEALEDIKEAFRLKLVDTDMIDLDGVEQSIARPEKAREVWIDRLDPTGLTDAISELEKWSGLYAKPEKPSQPETPIAPPPLALSQPATPPVDAPARPEPNLPIRHETARVGRNDPCPCGSGKKYKKCCLSVK